MSIMYIMFLYRLKNTIVVRIALLVFQITLLCHRQLNSVLDTGNIMTLLLFVECTELNPECTVKYYDNLFLVLIYCYNIG